MAMMAEDAKQFTCNCFSGEAASCTFACPYHIDLRGMLKKAARGRVDSCYKDMINAASFPAVAGALCGRQCQQYCQRSTIGDEPVQIYEIEQACIALTKSHVPEAFASVPKEGNVAVIGAGPAGLASAFQIALKGYPVTVFEQSNEIGGCLKGRPDFAVLKEDIDSKFQITSVRFELSHTVSALEELAEYSAVIVATGAEGSSFGVTDLRHTGSFQTEYPKVFAIGQVCGVDACQALAEGNAVANPVEAFLISGKTDFAHKDWNTAYCGRYTDHSGENSKPPIVKAGEHFTKDEVKKEAGRCMQCDCADCMNVCEHLRKYKGNPLKYAIDVYQDSQVRPPITAHSVTKAVYACNDCGRCSKACRQETDLPGLFCFSRQNRMERGDYPPAFHDHWLRSQDYCSGEAAFTLEGSEPSYAFFPGCQLGAANPDYVEKTYELLRDRFGAGLLQACCGAPSYWGGDRQRMEANTAYLRCQWEALGSPKLICACASCVKMLKRFLPEAETVYLYELLTDIAPAGSFSDLGTVSVFDPCAVTDKGSAPQAVRKLAQACGAKVSDYDSDGQCCGNGGHMRLADPELYGEIIRNRAEDSENPYVVYCVNCREVFRSQGKSCRHILEGLLNMDAGDTPHLEEKARNSMKVKVRLLDKYKKESFVPPVKEWDSLELRIDAEVRAAMEGKMITDSDVRECIWAAERDCEGFYNAEDNTVLACLVRKALTYWVRYRKEADGSFSVLDAYCHRMHFRENE